MPRATRPRGRADCRSWPIRRATQRGQRRAGLAWWNRTHGASQLTCALARKISISTPDTAFTSEFEVPGRTVRRRRTKARRSFRRQQRGGRFSCGLWSCSSVVLLSVASGTSPSSDGDRHYTEAQVARQTDTPLGCPMANSPSLNSQEECRTFTSAGVWSTARLVPIDRDAGWQPSLRGQLCPGTAANRVRAPPPHDDRSPVRRPAAASRPDRRQVRPRRSPGRKR